MQSVLQSPSIAARVSDVTASLPAELFLRSGKNTAGWKDYGETGAAAAGREFTHKTVLYRGRHSTVYSCLCRSTLQRRVVKAYDKSTMRARHFCNVRREINILSRFAQNGHPGIVRLLDSYEDAGHIYLVQEHCERGDLFQHLAACGGMMSEDIICQTIVQPLLETLSYTHSFGILHRDIKVENLFLTQDGELKLGDFGLALNVALERPTARVGTLDYMSPEVLSIPTPEECLARGLTPQNMPVYNEKVDIWAVGILAYELLTGRPPFEVEDMQETAELIKHASVDRFPSHASLACTNFIQQALQKDPNNRPNAAQLLQHPWFQPGTASPAQQFMSRDGCHCHGQAALPGALHAGFHHGHANVPQASFMPAPWPRSLLDELRSQDRGSMANDRHPQGALSSILPTWEAAEHQSIPRGHSLGAGFHESPKPVPEAGVAAGWQPLHSSWKGAALHLPASRPVTSPAEQQASGPCKPGSSASLPRSMPTLGSSSAYDLPQHGFLKLQPGLAAAWDVDGNKPVTGPPQPATWPAAASPFGGQAVQHAQQHWPPAVPLASGGPKAMDWQPSMMSHAAKDAKDVMANPRRQNSAAVLIAPPSADAPSPLQSTSPENTELDSKCSSGSKSIVNPPACTFLAPGQERADQAGSHSPLHREEIMPRLQASQSVPTFHSPSSRSAKRPCALHSSLGWGSRGPMHHDAPGLRHSLPGDVLTRPIARWLRPSLDKHMPSGQEQHAEEQLAASSELLEIAGVGHPSAALHMDVKNGCDTQAPAISNQSCKPAQRSAAAGLQGCEQVRQGKRTLTSSKEPGLVRLSTGGDSPAWRISAHDWMASQAAGHAQASTADRPSAISTGLASNKQLHAPHSTTLGHAVADTIEARLAPGRAPLPAHIHHNPLYHDDAMLPTAQEHADELDTSLSAKHPTSQPAGIDECSTGVQHEQVLEVSLSAPANDVDHEDLRLSQTRFSGTGTAPPKPKRMALESGPCSPVNRQTLFRRAHSEPLHALGPSSRLQDGSEAADEAAPATLHAGSPILADLPAHTEVPGALAGPHADAQLNPNCQALQIRDLRHLVVVPMQADDAPVMGLAEGVQQAQHREAHARSVPSRGPSSAAASSSAGASALSSRQSSRSAVAWPNWADLQAQCSSSANVAAAAASSGAPRRHISQMTATSSGVTERRRNADGPMQASMASSVASMLPAQAPLPLTLPDGLFPFHLERPSREHGLLGALFVAPHPHETMPRRAEPGLAPEQALYGEPQLPGSSSLQRTNSFNNRMRNWFLKRKA